MLVGIAGTLLPLLPGTTIILVAAVGNHLILGEASKLSWWTVVGLTVLVIVSYGIDFVSGAVGARYFGATRWGAIGGFIGAIVGLFFGILGVFIGPIVGVLIGELIGGRELVAAGKSTWGTLLGTTAGIISKLTIAITMIAWFALDAMW
jgi:uncharacterized protein YqgC (DUF456 family)